MRKFITTVLVAFIGFTAMAGAAEPSFDPPYDPYITPEGEVMRDSIIVACGPDNTMVFTYNAWDLVPRWFHFYKAGELKWSGTMEVGDTYSMPNEDGWSVGYWAGPEWKYNLTPGDCQPVTTTTPTTTPTAESTTTTAPVSTPTTVAEVGGIVARAEATEAAPTTTAPPLLASNESGAVVRSELARTGIPAWQMALVAVILIAAGSLLVVAYRKPSHG